MKRFIFIFTMLLLWGISSCNNNEEPGLPGSITLHFNHLINNQEIVFDEMGYTNAAGNTYEVSEIQWFISDVTLVNDKNEELVLGGNLIAHYIDTDIPTTWSLALPDEIPSGNYQSIKITFGIKGEKNIPYAFPNSPESDMQWPYNLGGDYGGYHYMKLNGFWMNTEDQRTPFNFHIGVGQEYDMDGNVTEFIQNWFETELPNSSFTLAPGTTQHIELIMNIENWFQNPNIYDHNTFGGKIMKNQTAMGMICENGVDVFSIKLKEVDNGGQGL